MFIKVQRGVMSYVTVHINCERNLYGGKKERDLLPSDIVIPSLVLGLSADANQPLCFKRFNMNNIKGSARCHVLCNRTHQL